MSEWAAEVAVDERLAERLIAGRFAPLPEPSLVALTEGWDYTVFLVDDAWVFRLPRREVVPGTEHEIAVPSCRSSRFRRRCRGRSMSASGRGSGRPSRRHAEATAVVYGDHHFRQLLVHEGELSGVIDWVDVCRADPGQDLQLVWSFLSPDARAEFLTESGPAPADSLLRARVSALNLSAILARCGHERESPVSRTRRSPH
jgi:aminoglycoside phosphotransferase (APT) family kinase protein